MMKLQLILCAIIAAFLALSTTTYALPLTLAQNGKTNYVIALANDAIPAEKTAAE